MTEPNKNSSTDSMVRHEVRHILHELSNTLTGLLMNTGLLSIALRGGERLRGYAEDIAEAGERGAVLVPEAQELVNQPVNAPQDGSGITDQCDGQPDTGRPFDPINMPSLSRSTQ